MKQARQSKLANPTLIYTQSGLREMCALLRTRPLIALDTESDSLYSYYPKVCLIQISTFADPDDTDPQRVLDYLVDPSVFAYEDGHVAIPQGPGLGIEVNEDFVRRAAAEGHRWRNPIWRHADGSFAEW